MIIQYFGEGCFRLQSGDTVLLVDPVNNRQKADVVLSTLTSTALPDVGQNEIRFPGEYEMKGIEVWGFPVAAESTEKFLKTIYLVHWEGMSFVFLGHLSKGMEPEALEKMSESDVLFFPFDGEHFLTAEAAAKLVKQLGPHVAIPSFSKNPSEILKAFGQKIAPQEKLVFKKKDLAADQDKIVILETS
ncbi:MAG: MBL fold metallo-hydrolase [Patescibacteria group bacterium]